MSWSTEALQRLSDFASGKTPASEFEQQLYNDRDIETLLSAESAPRFCQTGTTLFHYLIGLDLGDPGHVLNAQDAVVSLLDKLGVKIALAGTSTAEYALLLDAQPHWLDADVKFLALLLDAAPDLPSKQRKVWFRQRILELFKYAKQPPRWLQSPVWPIGDAGPFVFLGQFPVANYFHDKAEVYVFHDQAKDVFTTLVQHY
ncbi:MAG: hypothetical protein EOP14_04135 [Pseudomonas sp.]|nr:MAG: hypothetical protein EOP14_04135 [Pseudomonas sp.]